MKFAALKKEILRAAKETGKSPEFFSENRARYTNNARIIAHQTLEALRPPDQNPQEWSLYTAEFANLIASEHLENPTGLRIGRDRKSTFLKRQLDKRGDDPTQNGFTFEDILEWVREVKDFTPDDASQGALHEGRSDEVVAGILAEILSSNQQFFDRDFSGLRREIEDFVDRGDDTGPLAKYLPQVSQAWLNFFSSIYPKELAEFARDDFRKRL